MQNVLVFFISAAPEEKYDGRCLYDQLKEQRDAKDLEFEESKKFKNMIRGLDDEDVDHLTEVDARKILSEKKQKDEELKELQDYRAKVAELQQLSHHQKISVVSSKPKPTSLRTTQRDILSSVVKRKAAPSQEPPLKRPAITSSQTSSALKLYAVLPGIGDYKSSDESGGSSDSDDLGPKNDLQKLIRTKKEQCNE